MEKIAYFYDPEQKTEAFGRITKELNYGPAKDNVCSAAREMLPSCVETFPLLTVKERAPLGTFISDKISIDFEQAVDTFKEPSWLKEVGGEDCKLLLPKDIHYLIPNKRTLLGREILENVNKLYAVRKFIEDCIEHPQLFSFGQFERLIRYTHKQGWGLKSLGFFTPVDSTPVGQYFISDKMPAEVAHNEVPCTTVLEDLRSSLRFNQLVRINKSDALEKGIEVFEISNGIDAVLVSLFHLIQERVLVKKCSNCGKYFVPLLRSDAIYCDRPAPQDDKKTCKEYGARLSWYENMMNDEVTKTARNIYYAKRMLAKRNPDRPEYAEMFSYYSVERKKWEAQIKAGKKTREEYADWLRKMKLCKTMAEWEQS